MLASNENTPCSNVLAKWRTSRWLSGKSRRICAMTWKPTGVEVRIPGPDRKIFFSNF